MNFITWGSGSNVLVSGSGHRPSNKTYGRIIILSRILLKTDSTVYIVVLTARGNRDLKNHFSGAAPFQPLPRWSILNLNLSAVKNSLVKLWSLYQVDHLHTFRLIDCRKRFHLDTSSSCHPSDWFIITLIAQRGGWLMNWPIYCSTISL